MPNIIIAATNGKLTKVRDTLLIEDNINTLTLKIEFRTSDWDNTLKTAMFVRGRATPTTLEEDIIPIILDSNNECKVPPEVLSDPGMFSVGVFGVAENYRIVSEWIFYKIKDGCFADGGASLEPTPTVYEQILLALNSKSDENHNHDDKYASSSAVATQIATALQIDGVDKYALATDLINTVERITTLENNAVQTETGTIDAGRIIERS